jgi:hypothetical protein
VPSPAFINLFRRHVGRGSQQRARLVKRAERVWRTDPRKRTSDAGRRPRDGELAPLHSKRCTGARSGWAAWRGRPCPIFSSGLPSFSRVLQRLACGRSPHIWREVRGSLRLVSITATTRFTLNVAELRRYRGLPLRRNGSTARYTPADATAKCAADHPNFRPGAVR